MTWGSSSFCTSLKKKTMVNMIPNKKTHLMKRRTRWHTVPREVFRYRECDISWPSSVHAEHQQGTLSKWLRGLLDMMCHIPNLSRRLCLEELVNPHIERRHRPEPKRRLRLQPQQHPAQEPRPAEVPVLPPTRRKTSTASWNTSFLK